MPIKCQLASRYPVVKMLFPAPYSFWPFLVSVFVTDLVPTAIGTSLSRRPLLPSTRHQSVGSAERQHGYLLASGSDAHPDIASARYQRSRAITES